MRFFGVQGIGLVLAGLCGCAAAPSFRKNPDQMQAVLHSKSATARTFAELGYKLIPSFPFKSANWTSADWEILDEHAQVFDFDGFKSYLLAYDLPAVGRARRFSFVSLPTTSHISTRGVFNPTFRVLDAGFRELAVHEDFPLTSEGVFEGAFDIPPEGRYLVVHTTREKLSRSGTFEYTSIEGGMTFTSTVKNPMLPEGAFRIGLE
ncbi:MAG: hypothetical protein HY749_06385 [Gammaproteobacteria bacterium]|nr:hypothetical protein [Gammaproteobacteria bacterium]